MAISIQQAPTTPNMANNDLVFAVTSSQVTQPQFQFVADLTYSGSNTVLQRIKQQPNPNARGVFDFGSIVTNYLSEDENWKTSKFATAVNAAKRFNFRFGEQYGTSTSSSITLYTGIGTGSGAPGVSGSTYTYLLNGLVDPNDKVNWNWASGSYYSDVVTPTGGADTIQAEYALTYAPTTKLVQAGEYETISLINGNFTNNTASAQDIYALLVEQYDSSNTLISSSLTFNTTTNGGGPRANDAQLWSDVATAQTEGTQLLTIGVGPQNLADAGTALSASCTYYTVKAIMQDSAGQEDPANYFSFRRYNVDSAYCEYPGVRFAWKNQFGVWDYFTFKLQNDKAFSIERANYQQSFVPFGDNTPVPYSKQRRGTVNYYNKPVQTQVANSDWLDQDTADWLRELFFSANVFYQDGTEFYPAVITSVDVTEKTNPRSPLFQYAIQFQVANQINPRV
jgi:hypothetical protein